MNELAFSSISTLKSWYTQKKISQPEVLDYFSKRYERYDKGQLNAALEIFDSASVLESVKEVTHPTARLAGIPGVVKDNICQKGRITSCGSKILQNFRSTYDATAIRKLKDDGALIMGRANCDEFAMGSSTETSAYFLSKNPWDQTRVPGGSSGGSAVAVAAGLAHWALGSETGGSVRQPAALCGIVGLKVTYGLISRYGLVAYGSSLDSIGLFTRSVADSAEVLSVLAGHDAKDSTSLKTDPVDYTRSVTGTLPSGITIGVITNALDAQGVDPDVHACVQEAIAVYEKMGARIKRIELPVLDYAAACYFIVSRAEAASNLARFDGVRYGMRAQNPVNLADMYERTRHDGFGKEVAARIMIGNYVLSAGHAGQFYDKACKVRALMKEQFAQAFKDVDLFVLPVSPTPAFTCGEFANDPLKLDLQDYFTCATNLTGVPAIALPCGFSRQGLPIGFQLVGPHLSEALLFQVGSAYQKMTDWHQKHPAGF